MTTSIPTSISTPLPTVAPTDDAPVLLLHIVRGRPSDEEIAAATTAMLAVIRRRACSESVIEEIAGVVGWTPERTHRPPRAWAEG